jgi:hypothetical protein
VSSLHPRKKHSQFKRDGGQQTFIHGIEALGLAAPYYAPELRSRFRGMDVLHCADNQAANDAFTRGYSARPDLARIIGAAHAALAELGVQGQLLTSPTCQQVTVTLSLRHTQVQSAHR